MVDIDLRKAPKMMLRPAGRLRRILAFIFDLLMIDIFIIGPFESVIRNNFLAITDMSNIQSFLEYGASNLGAITQIIMTIGILALAYFSISEYKTGQTLGMFVAGIYLKPKEGNLTFWKCALRNIFTIPVFPIILLWVIDPIYLFIVKERLSDILLKLEVVEVQMK